MSSITQVSDAIQATLKELGINGSYDVRFNQCRSTGWIGQPTGDDFEVVVTIKPLPPLRPEREPYPARPTR